MLGATPMRFLKCLLKLEIHGKPTVFEMFKMELDVDFNKEQAICILNLIKYSCGDELRFLVKSLLRFLSLVWQSFAKKLISILFI